MPRFFTGSICDNDAAIVGEDARHMALSLRMKVGERVVVCDEKGLDYHCVIASITPELVSLTVEQVLPSEGEATVDITLFQAMPKGDKLELIVQKASELGVSKIVPILTERCISRPSGNTMDKKMARLQKIAAEAAKQAGRGQIPEVASLLSFEAAVKQLADFQTPLFCYENGNVPLREVLEGKSHQKIAIMVGSEGGFSQKEAARAAELGLSFISLGSRILRCETAPLAVLSAVLYSTCNL